MKGLGVTDDCEQKFDFSFEEEDSIDGMKKLIVDEVNSFRAEVRAHARAAGQIRRQDRYTTLSIHLCFTYEPHLHSLPIPSREEIMNSPMQETGSTSGFTDPKQRAPSPVMDDPSAQLERELAGTHLQK